MNDISRTMELNTEFPIKLSNIEPLIDRVAAKYPLVSKVEVILVVKAFFEALREELIAGKNISLNSLFTNAHLISITRANRYGFYKTVKIKSNTPKEIRNG